MKTKEEHAEMMAQKFNEIMDAHSIGNLGASEAVITGLQILRFYLESSHHMFKTPNFNMFELSKALENTRLGPERKIIDRQFLEGCLIEGLVRFGPPDSKEQIYKFMFDFTGISKTACKTSHKIFNDLYYTGEQIKDQDNLDFLAECYNWIVDFVGDKKRRILDNKKYPKALIAFSALLDTCQSEAEKNKNSVYSASPLRPYESYSEIAKSYEAADRSKQN